MSVMGIKKSLDGGWVGQALSNFCLDFWNFFNFAKPLTKRYLPAGLTKNLDFIGIYVCVDFTMTSYRSH